MKLVPARLRLSLLMIVWLLLYRLAWHVVCVITRLDIGVARTRNMTTSRYSVSIRYACIANIMLLRTSISLNIRGPAVVRRWVSMLGKCMTLIVVVR